MHVLYVHQYFSTREGAAGTRSYEMARALTKKGHRVTMLCGSTGRSVTGLDGPFLKNRRTGTVDGIDVIEFDVSYTNYDSLLKRAWKFASFALRSTAAALRFEYDMIFTTSTPLTAAIPGTAAAILRRKPFVFEIRDLWPELPHAMGMRNPVALAAMHVLEWMGYRSATRLIALAPGIADGIARLGVPRDRIDIVPNGCDIAPFDEIEAVPPHAFFPEQIEANDLVAIFAGAHGLANGLNAVIDAAEVLKRRGRGDIKFLLVGDGVCKPDLMKAAEAKLLDNVVFHDPIPKKQLMGLLKGTHVGLQILADIPAFYRGTSPNKFFDYLAAKRPVLINYPGWLAELVQQETCGFAVPPRNPDAFADALIEAADNRPSLEAMAVRAGDLGRREFSRSQLASHFTEALESACLHKLPYKGERDGA